MMATGGGRAKKARLYFAPKVKDELEEVFCFPMSNPSLLNIYIIYAPQAKNEADKDLYEFLLVHPEDRPLNHPVPENAERRPLNDPGPEIREWECRRCKQVTGETYFPRLDLYKIKRHGAQRHEHLLIRYVLGDEHLLIRNVCHIEGYKTMALPEVCTGCVGDLRIAVQSFDQLAVIGSLQEFFADTNIGHVHGILALILSLLRAPAYVNKHPMHPTKNVPLIDLTTKIVAPFIDLTQ